MAQKLKHFSITQQYSDRYMPSNQPVSDPRCWAKFIDWYFHEVGGAYREETTVNQVIGHGIEFSLPAVGRSSSWSSYRATAPSVV